MRPNRKEEIEEYKRRAGALGRQMRKKNEQEIKLNNMAALANLQDNYKQAYQQQMKRSEVPLSEL